VVQLVGTLQESAHSTQIALMSEEQALNGIPAPEVDAMLQELHGEEVLAYEIAAKVHARDLMQSRVQTSQLGQVIADHDENRLDQVFLLKLAEILLSRAVATVQCRPRCFPQTARYQIVVKSKIMAESSSAIDVLDKHVNCGVISPFS